MRGEVGLDDLGERIPFGLCVLAVMEVMTPPRCSLPQGKSQAARSTAGQISQGTGCCYTRAHYDSGMGGNPGDACPRTTGAPNC